MYRTLVGITALTTFAAGVIHIPVAGAHDLHTLLGGGMLTTAVAQIALASALASALALRRRGGPALLALSLPVNAAAAVILAFAYTTGLPFAGLQDPETFTGQAVAVLGLESTAALTALLALAVRPGTPALRRVASAFVAVTVLAVAAPAVAAGPDHDHDHDHGTHGSAAGHDHGSGGPPQDRYTAYTAGMTPAQVDAALAGEAGWLTDYLLANSPARLSRDTAQRYSRNAVEQVVRSADPFSVGGEAHTGPSGWQPVGDPATRATEARQLQQARAAALAYPTAADAVRAGYVQVSPYLPGIGAHYVNRSYFLDGRLDAAHPEILLYGSNAPDAPVVGVSYLQTGSADQQPTGFAGPNDLWHFHNSLCVVPRMMVIPAPDEPACNSVGGTVRSGFAGQQVWMMHAWVVPGWESPWGLYSAENPELTLAVGQQQ
jgi:hypothetical protein